MRASAVAKEPEGDGGARETLASIPSNERQPHSVNPTTEIFYFPVPSYARFKGTEGDCEELTAKWSKRCGRVALSLFDSHRGIRVARITLILFPPATFRATVTDYYRKPYIIPDNGGEKNNCDLRTVSAGMKRRVSAPKFSLESSRSRRSATRRFERNLSYSFFVHFVYMKHSMLGSSREQTSVLSTIRQCSRASLL